MIGFRAFSFKTSKKICESALLNVIVYDILTMDDYKASYIVLFEITVVFNPDERTALLCLNQSHGLSLNG